MAPSEKEYYSSFKNQILAQRKRLRSLTLQKKIQGDYYEALVRELIREHVSKKYSVGHGLVFNELNQKSSNECDIIIYDSTNRQPMLKYKDLVIVNPDDVRIVIQVKSNLNSLKNPIENLKSVKVLNEKIMCGIIGFTTHTYFRTLYLNAWKSGIVNFLNVFTWKNPKHPTRKRNPVNDKLLSIQSMLLIKFLRRYSGGDTFGYTKNFVIYIDPDHHDETICLDAKANENVVEKILSEIYTKGFRKIVSD